MRPIITTARQPHGADSPLSTHHGSTSLLIVSSAWNMVLAWVSPGPCVGGGGILAPPPRGAFSPQRLRASAASGLHPLHFTSAHPAPCPRSHCPLQGQGRITSASPTSNCLWGLPYPPTEDSGSTGAHERVGGVGFSRVEYAQPRVTPSLGRGLPVPPPCLPPQLGGLA